MKRSIILAVAAALAIMTTMAAVLPSLLMNSGDHTTINGSGCQPRGHEDRSTPGTLKVSCEGTPAAEDLTVPANLTVLATKVPTIGSETPSASSTATVTSIATPSSTVTVTLTPTPTQTTSTATATQTPTALKKNTSTPQSTVTATATPTASSNTATATMTPSSTPGTITPTVTPTVAAGEHFDVSIRLSGDQRVVDFYNQHALLTDAAHADASGIGQLVQINARKRSISIGTPADAANAISLAKANGIPDIVLNEEGPPCAQLQVDEAAAAAEVHRAGLTFSFGPTGLQLASFCGPAALTGVADRLVFQTQNAENYPSVYPDYAGYVHGVIRQIHASNPRVLVTAQVSVNPPQNPSATAAQCLADIALIQDGSADQADQIQVYYAGANIDPSREPVMEQVITSLRS